jgi:hypothetical protein
MSGESAYQLYEGFKVVLPLAPIALVLTATIFLHRKEKGRLTQWMVISTALCLLFSTFSYVISAWERHIFNPGELDPDKFDRSLIYEHIAEICWVIGNVAFIAFTISLLRYFRVSKSAGPAASSQSSS